MRTLAQNQTAQPLMFFMVLASDHSTAATGLSPTVTLSKNGGSFASPTGAVSELSDGWYKVAGNATDANTLGPLVLHATAATADPVDVVFQVIAVDPNVAKVPATLAAADVSGNVPADVKAYTVQPTVTGATLAAAYDAAKTAATQTSVDSVASDASAAASNSLEAMLAAQSVDGKLPSDTTTKINRLDATVSSRLTYDRTTIYVAASGGNNANSGLTPSLPKATLAGALAIATAGCRIMLSPGTHAVGAVAELTLAGMEISGWGRATILDFTTVGGAAGPVIRLYAAGLTLRDFTVISPALGIGYVTAAPPANATNFVLENVRVEGLRDTLIFNGCSNPLSGVVRRCAFITSAGGTDYTIDIDAAAGSLITFEDVEILSNIDGAVITSNVAFELRFISGRITGTAAYHFIQQGSSVISVGPNFQYDPAKNGAGTPTQLPSTVTALSDGIITAAKVAAAALNGKGDWNTVAPDNAAITAIKGKTDSLPASPAAVGSAMALTAAYDAAKTAAQAGDAMALVTGAITPSKIGTGALSGKGDWVASGGDLDNLATYMLTMLEVVGGGPARRFTGAALTNAPTGGGGSGNGAFVYTVTVTASAVAVSGAIVAMTDGVNRYTATTNGIGVATFGLDAADYDLTVSKSGYQHTPQSVSVSGAGNTAATITAITVPIPALPSQTTATGVTRDSTGAVKGSVTLHFELLEGTGDAGGLYDNTPFSVTSNATTGVVAVTLVQGALYHGKYEDGLWIKFRAASTPTSTLPEVLGRPTIPT